MVIIHICFNSYLYRNTYLFSIISNRFRSDHNEDRSIDIIKAWLKRVTKKYHSVDFGYRSDAEKRYDEKSSTHWSEDRFADVIRLKQEALDKGRKMWADFVLVSRCFIFFIYLFSSFHLRDNAHHNLFKLVL